MPATFYHDAVKKYMYLIRNMKRKERTVLLWIFTMKLVTDIPSYTSYLTNIYMCMYARLRSLPKALLAYVY